MKLTLVELLPLLKMGGNGDDNIIVCDRSLYRHTSTVANTLTALGLVPKVNVCLGENALNKCSFLSCRFYPVEYQGRITRCLGPNLGRVYSKYGYYVNAPEKLRNAFVRGDAISRYCELNYIPFLRLLNDKLMRLTQGCQARFRRSNRDDRITADNEVKYTPEVWEMLADCYDLNPSQETEYRVLLNSINSLPARVDFVPLTCAAYRDAGLDDSTVVTT